MKPGVLSAKKSLFIPLLALALPVLAPLPRLCAQVPPGQDSSFDYTPAKGEKIEETERPTVRINFNDVEVIRNPQTGITFISKHRWRNWVERALYLILVNIALLVILGSLPKNDENNLIVSYFLSGISFMLDFWVFLCAVLLFKFRSISGAYVLPVSAAMCGATYYLLLKIKKADISLSDLKDSFRQQSRAGGSDQRLASVDGSPGDWPEQDFLK